MILNAIIQCRMTSSRFPGKVLAPIMGKPLLDHVVEQIKKTKSCSSIILATSVDKADDPLSCYAHDLGLHVVRGSRDNVFDRFSLALESFHCEAFFRVCADSPLLFPKLFDFSVSIYKIKTFDLITNIFPRTFPEGMSVELIKTETFLNAKKNIVNKEDKEHISRYFYNNHERFNIYNIECNKKVDKNFKLAVDDLNDIGKIETWCSKNLDKIETLFPIKLEK